MLQISFHLQCELNSVRAFSDSHYHLLHLSSLPPNPCKSKPDLNSRSLISFSTIHLHQSQEVRHCVALLLTRQDCYMGCCIIRSWFVFPKWGKCFRSRKTESWQLSFPCVLFLLTFLDHQLLLFIISGHGTNTERKHLPEHLLDQIACITSENETVSWVIKASFFFSHWSYIEFPWNI